MRFNYGKIFLLGFGFFGVSIIWATYNAFVPIFLQDKFGLQPALIGFFMTLDNIAALLIQPPVGAWSDRLRTPIGRRMPFILIGAPIGAIVFGLIPLAAVLPLFVACTTTLLLSMAFWRTPVIALMPDITPSQNRSQANGIINFMGGLGSIIAFLGGSKLYDMNPAYPFWLGSGLVIMAALLVFLLIREPKVYEDSHEEKPSLIASLKTVLTDPDRSALRVLLAILLLVRGLQRGGSFLYTVCQKPPAVDRIGWDSSVGAAFIVLCALCVAIRISWKSDWTARYHLYRHCDHDPVLAGYVLYASRYAHYGAHQAAHFRSGAGHRCDPDGCRDRLGLHQHQLTAHGGGYDRCDPPGDLHRAVLPVFHPGSHCWSEHQRLDHPAQRQGLQHDHDCCAILHGTGIHHDDRRASR